MGSVYAYYGEGRGKTTLAIGQGVRAIGEGLQVVMIQFMDYNYTKESIPLKTLEPAFRIFRFEKHRLEVDPEDPLFRKEVASEVRNALNFTKKIMETEECDMLIMDGVFQAIASGCLSETEVLEVLKKRPPTMDVIMTGSVLSEMVAEAADFVYRLCTVKKKLDL